MKEIKPKQDKAEHLTTSVSYTNHKTAKHKAKKEERNYQQLEKIYIDSIFTDSNHPKYQNSPIVKNILTKASSNIVEIIEDSRSFVSEYSQAKLPPELGKKTLIVHPHCGRFMDLCPGSGGMRCCNYFVINTGLNCLYDCHYCFLQTYLNNALTSVFGNWEDMKKELEQRLQNKKMHIRLGTGEFTDSLVLDPLTGLSTLLIEFFAKQSNATLELKTKSVNVDHLLKLDSKGHTVIAWSLNPPSIISSIEDYTPSLEQRLEVAKKVMQAGYKLAFHFDPIIYFSGWEDQYKALIEQLFDSVDSNKIAWISLGTFRYSPGMSELIYKRFPNDTLNHPEMLGGSDGKMRYYREIRQNIYSKMKAWLEEKDPNIFTYLCMDTRAVWKQVYGFDPGSRKKLDSLFEKRRIKVDKYMKE